MKDMEQKTSLEAKSKYSNILHQATMSFYAKERKTSNLRCFRAGFGLLQTTNLWLSSQLCLDFISNLHVLHRILMKSRLVDANWFKNL
jgi:hypothetical protein